MAVTGVEARIYDALVWYVSQQTFDPALRVAMPGVAFTPEQGKPFLAVDYFPNTSRLDGLPFDSDVTHLGLFQLSVVWPAGQGFVKPLQVAAQVRQAFAAGTRLWRNDLTVCIDETPEVAGPIDDAPWVRFPVTVRWRVGVPAAP
ncbi:DUF4128 domain-containing protein [Methylobacterium nodulans]|uniref:Tail terminator n=1 Tax=Methylobacterium nodulans (strain LMG 21967 / CNCM I-2342 / ORS 2060) TaxID=460265 RepID=B8INT5_METNO|nr:DUF4128 domain-containing protein [Methylobacterium nodulans]ACL58451.1 conserved hypothetical protein [Methylobacterium nodulans ORS 2060]